MSLLINGPLINHVTYRIPLHENILFLSITIYLKKTDSLKKTDFKRQMYYITFLFNNVVHPKQIKGF